TLLLNLGRTSTGWIPPACGWRTHSITSSASAGRQNTPSLQLIGHFVDPGFDARFVLFAARRARSAGCADDLVAYLNRQRALVGYDVGEMDQAERRIRL